MTRLIVLFFLILCQNHSYFSLQAHDFDDAPLPDNFKQLLNWEIRANSFHKDNRKSPYQFNVSYIEIAAKFILEDINDDLFTPSIRESMMNEKRQTIRWVLNPEDTKYKAELIRWLKKMGQDATIKQDRFNGFLTSSRSMILQDRINGAIFSLKVSTDWTGGGFKKGKHLPMVDAKESRRGTDFVYSIWQKNKNRIKHSVYLWESASFSIKEIDRSMIIRNYDELVENQNNNLYYLPGFSALFPTVGSQIAASHTNKNDSASIAQYWLENYTLPLARAFAEFAAYFGMSYESAHSQQFLIEMIKKEDGILYPTGRIVMRDFNDSFPYGEYPLHPARLIKSWRMMNKRDHLNVRFGILKAINKKQVETGWINDSLREEWGKLFFAEFEKQYSKITGVPKKELNLHTIFQGTTGSYLVKSYFNESQIWKVYLKRLTKCYLNEENSFKFYIGGQPIPLECSQYLSRPKATVKSFHLPKGKKRSGPKIIDRLKVNVLDRF